GNLWLVHVRITRVTARRPVSYGISCSASNHADTWPGRRLSGALSMASQSRPSSLTACSRVTTRHPLVLSFPLICTGQNHRDGVVVRRPRVRSSPGAQVVRGTDAVVVPVANYGVDVRNAGDVPSQRFVNSSTHNVGGHLQIVKPKLEPVQHAWAEHAVSNIPVVVGHFLHFRVRAKFRTDINRRERG